MAFQPAFYGLRGFAAVTTTGGRGLPIYHVTTLADSGAGSLRQRIIDAAGTGGGNIVFDVSGVITLLTDLVIDTDNLSIWGETAPLGGITTVKRRIRIDAENVIIRHLEFLLGDFNYLSVPADSYRTLFVNPTAGNTCKNVILDHCNFAWGIDGNGNFINTSGVETSTCMLSNSISAEPLNNSVHNEGGANQEHGACWDVQGGCLGGMTFYKNVFGKARFRAPQISNRGNNELVNCLAYGDSVQFAELEDNGNINFIHSLGNLFIPSSDTPNGLNPIRDGLQNGASRIFLRGNHYTSLALEAYYYNQSALISGAVRGIATALVFEPSNVRPMITTDRVALEAFIVSNVGARAGDSSAWRTRILREIASRSGRKIDSQSQVGGYPLITSITRAWVEPANPTLTGYDGFTNLENAIRQAALRVEAQEVNAKN